MCAEFGHTAMDIGAPKVYEPLLRYVLQSTLEDVRRDGIAQRRFHKVRPLIEWSKNA